MRTILIFLIIVFFSSSLNAKKYYYKTFDFEEKHHVTDFITNTNNTFSIGGFITNDDPTVSFILNINDDGTVNNKFLNFNGIYNELYGLVTIENNTGMVGLEGDWGQKSQSFFTQVSENGEATILFQSDTLEFIYVYKRVIQALSGHYYVIGYTIYNDSEETFPYLLSLDSGGGFLWDTIYTEIPSVAWIQDIALSSDGGLYLFMTIDKSQFSSDALLMKVDSLGNQEWGKIFNYAAQDAAVKILESKEGGFLVALFAAFGKPRIVKLDEDRNIEFVLDNIFTDHIADIIQLEDYTYIMMGRAEIMDANWETHKTDIQLAKIDQKGNLLWSRIYEDNGYDKDKSMVVTPDGGFMLACNKEVGQVNKIFLIKTNCLGLLTEPEVSFTYEEAAGEVTFTNTSLYVYPDSIDGGYYVWDFGDGSAVSNEVNPVHTYTEADEYTVRLTGIVCSDTSVYEQTVSVTTTSVGSPSSPSLEEALRVYPNPVDGDVLYFEVGGDYVGQQGRILFYNTLGQVVLRRENSRIFSNTGIFPEGKTKIDVSNLPGGVYFVVVEIGGERVVEKVVVN